MLQCGLACHYVDLRNRRRTCSIGNCGCSQVEKRYVTEVLGLYLRNANRTERENQLCCSGLPPMRRSSKVWFPEWSQMNEDEPMKSAGRPRGYVVAPWLKDGSMDAEWGLFCPIRSARLKSGVRRSGGGD